MARSKRIVSDRVTLHAPDLGDLQISYTLKGRTVKRARSIEARAIQSRIEAEQSFMEAERKLNTAFREVMDATRGAK